MRLLALLLAALAQAQNCPDGWQYHEKNCYYFRFDLNAKIAKT